MLTYAKIKRPLEPSDLVDVPVAAKAPTIKRLRERHYRLARLLAEGFTPTQAAMYCGVTPANVHQLKKDPLFQQAVIDATKSVDAAAYSNAERLSELTGLALETIIQRLDDAPADFSVDELERLVKLGADRTGLAPGGKDNGGITINIAERMEAAQSRLNPRTIDVTPKEPHK